MKEYIESVALNIDDKQKRKQVLDKVLFSSKNKFIEK